MKQYRKLAVFGGTFSPIHNGHLHALLAYANTVRPDVVYVIPTAVAHKTREDTATALQRIEMLRQALANIALPCPVVISDLEIRRGGKSYTIDTVRELSSLAEEIVIFCGTDMLFTLEKWRGFRHLISTVSVAYMQREEDCRYQEKVAEKAAWLSEHYGAELISLNSVPCEISSGDVRKAVRNGEDISGMVPESVARYIATQGLYT